MNKTWLVAKFEVIRQLKKPSFWIALLLLPLAIFVIMGLSTLDSYNLGNNIADGSSYESAKIGIMNESGMFDKLPQSLESFIASANYENPATVSLVSDKAEGINEVKSGALDIFYYLPANFAENFTIDTYYHADSASLLTDYGLPFSSALKAEAISSLSLENQIAVNGLFNFNITSFDSDGTEVNPLGDAIIPIAVLAIFYILICVFGNRLVTSLAEEKENRISEMILTSVSTKKLVIGKIISLILLGFIQIAIFIIPLIAILIIYRDNEIVSTVLNMITFDPWLIISNILLLLVSYFFYAGACTLVSSLMPTARDASNYFGIVMMGTMMPLFFISSFLFDTPTLVVYILSYFPLSAPISLMLRNAFGFLPTYELVIGIVELALCSALTLALTVKSFQKNAINFSVAKLNLAPRKNWKK